MPSPTEPGRPAPSGRTRTSAAQRAAAVARVRAGEATIVEVAGALGVQPSTVRRWIREADAARSRGPTEPTAAAPSLPQAAAAPQPPPPEPATPVAARTEPPPQREPTSGAGVEPPSTAVPEAGAHHGPVAGHPGAGHPGAEKDPDRVLPQVHRLRSRHRYLVVVGCWLAMLLVSAVLPGPGALRGVLQLGHVVGLAASVGAVAVIDWHGLLWMGRKRDLRETARIAAAVSPLIWAGLGLLGVTGVLLKPDLGSPLVWLKMVAVLVLAINGVTASETRQVLRGVPAGVAFADVPRPLATRLVASAALSQLAWFTAIVVGLSSQAARS